jgi:predicted RNA-binding protein with PIN domain
MNYIIDGHNLVPYVPSMSLSDLDDELKLTAFVSEFCRLSRSHAELYFDGAPPPQKSPSGGGQVHVHFVRKGTPADEEIIRFMHHAGHNARNYTLVSSDHHIQSEARSLGVTILDSPVFAQRMIQVLSAEKTTSDKAEPGLSEQEVQGWLDEFNPTRPRSS